MRYFSKRTINQGFQKNFSAYQKELAKLEGRISRQAWNFFAFGFRGWGLHDGRLLVLSVGDGLDHLAGRRRRFDENKGNAKVRILILNRNQTLLYSFVCGGIRKVVFKYPVQSAKWGFRRIEMLETYELTSANKDYLSLEFLFASNATLLVEFKKLIFKRKRVSGIKGAALGRR